MTDRVLLRAGELAEKFKAELFGSADATARGLETLDRAGPEHLSFVRDARYLERWAMSRCAVAFVSRAALKGAPLDRAVSPGRALIVVDDADVAIVGILEMLAPPPPAPTGVHPRAYVDPAAKCGQGVSVGPCACIGAGSDIGDGTYIHSGAVIGAGVRIGRGCVIHPGVVLQERSVLGDRVVLHPGVVVGADGFGYRPDPSGQGIRRIPHLGNVEIQSLVEVGANTAIDRAKFGSTVIGAGTKIDNLVQIGHGCRIGRACLICGTCAIAGSVTIGDGATLGGGVGVADNIAIGAGATIGGRSGVMRNVPAGETWLGYPAAPARITLRAWSVQDRLPEVVTHFRRLLRDQMSETP